MTHTNEAFFQYDNKTEISTVSRLCSFLRTSVKEYLTKHPNGTVQFLDFKNIDLEKGEVINLSETNPKNFRTIMFRFEGDSIPGLQCMYFMRENISKRIKEKTKFSFKVSFKADENDDVKTHEVSFTFVGKQFYKNEDLGESEYYRTQHLYESFISINWDDVIKMHHSIKELKSFNELKDFDLYQAIFQNPYVSEVMGLVKSMVWESDAGNLVENPAIKMIFEISAKASEANDEQYLQFAKILTPLLNIYEHSSSLTRSELRQVLRQNGIHFRFDKNGAYIMLDKFVNTDETALFFKHILIPHKTSN